MKARILFVDDDESVLKMHRQAFSDSYLVETAENVPAAFAAIEKGESYAAIVSDMDMPEISGVELFEELRKKAPETMRLMLTGTNQETAIDAINRGQVFRYLTKPCLHLELRAAIEAAVLQYQLVRAERDLLEKTLGASVKVLSEILSMVAPAIFGRTEKLRRHLRQFHRATGLGVAWELDVAATLAPIGLVTLPGSLLPGGAKSGPRSAAEEALLASVPRIGHRLIAGIPRLEEVAQVILYQRHRYDGGGALFEGAGRGEAIPLGARILKVLAELVALEDEGHSRHASFDEMRRRQPGCYDPKILTAAQEVFAPRAIAAEEKTSRLLKLSELSVGHVLVSPIHTQQGMLLVAAGAEITEVLLKRLSNFAELSGLREPIEVEAAMAGDLVAVDT